MPLKPANVYNIARRLAHLPFIDNAAVFIEDYVTFLTHAATSNQSKQLSESIGRCQSTEDWIKLARTLFSVTQIDSEIKNLIDLCKKRDVRRIIEIGTAHGGTTTLLCNAIPNVNWLLTVDTLPRHRRLLNHINSPKVSFHTILGSSQDPITINKITEATEATPIDLLFIDGDYSYAGARADYSNYRRIVRPRGLIALHDIVPAPEVGAPTNGHRWVGGVPRLWSELRNSHKNHWEFVENWNQQGYGIGVVESSE